MGSGLKVNSGDMIFNCNIASLTLFLSMPWLMPAVKG